MYHIENWSAAAHPLTLDSGELHLWRIELDGDHPAQGISLSADEQERAARLLDPRDQQRFIQARSALRSILAGYLDTPPDKLCFDYGEHGKPSIQHPANDLHFNLSHSHGMALLAVSRQPELGIDLEWLQAKSHFKAIAHRLFDKKIQQELASLEGEPLIRTFYRYWTAHEACLKARGSGVFQGQAASGGPPLNVENFVPAEGWMAAVATTASLAPAHRWKTFIYEPSLEKG